MFLIESIQRYNHTDLCVFSRNEKGEKEIRIISDFKPYFYIPEDDPIPDDYRITGSESGYKDLFDNPVKKIFITKSKEIPNVKSLFKKHYEADILFNQRYVIDEYGVAEVYPLKTLSIDIETNTKNTFPNLETPDQEIISCAFKDTFGGKKVLFYKSPESTVEIEEKDYLTVYDTEEEMLEGIVSYIKENDPDVITGWYSDKFDIPYLTRRMKQFGIDVTKLSPLKSVWEDKYNAEIKMKGRILLDMLKLYKKFRRISNQGGAESYSLEFTAQDVLGIGKIKHQENFHDFWIDNPNKLIEYNLRDAELVIQINEKLDIINFFNYLRAISYAQMSQIFTTSSLVDGFLLRKAHNKAVLPSKPEKKEGDQYKGAHVFEPIPGVYDNVLALDVKGLYPNIIKTFNVGFETFNPDGEIKLEEGLGFNKGEGMISESMTHLQNERNKYKKLMKEANDDASWKLNHYKQYSVKVLANSFYGYLGFPGGRFYKREIAQSITKWGKLLLHWTEKHLKKKGYVIRAGDTDSVYIQANSSGLLNLLKEGRHIVAEINESYKEFAKKYGSDNCTLELEFEKIFKNVIFVGKKGSDQGAKKKYAYTLLWQDGKKVEEDEVNYTGFETVRSDTPRIARDAQKKVLQMVLNREDKENIVSYLKDLDKKIRNNEIPMEELGVPTGITKQLHKYGEIKIENGKRRRTGTPPVIVGARYSNKYLGTQFAEGSKPKWLYIKNVPKGYPETNVLSFDEKLPEGFIPDYELLINKLFKMKLEEIFKAVGFGAFPNIDSSATDLKKFFR